MGLDLITPRSWPQLKSRVGWLTDWATQPSLRCGFWSSVYLHREKNQAIYRVFFHTEIFRKIHILILKCWNFFKRKLLSPPFSRTFPEVSAFVNIYILKFFIEVCKIGWKICAFYILKIFLNYFGPFNKLHHYLDFAQFRGWSAW